MPVYKAPVAETLFLLNDVLGIGRYQNLPGFADATPDVVEAVLTKARSSPRKCSCRSTGPATSKAARAIPTAA